MNEKYLLKKEEISNKIIDLVTFTSKDRLIVFRPEKKISGVDLVVKKRSEYESLSEEDQLGNIGKIKKIIGFKKEKKTVEIELQVNDILQSQDKKSFEKDILEKDFKAEENFYLVFVDFDQVKQNIIENVFIVPSLYFRDVAKRTKLKDNKNTYKFQVSVNLKEQNEYSKFLINKQDVADFLLGIIESKEKFDESTTNFNMARAVNFEELKEFISEARASTYAKDAKQIENPRLNGSKQLEYQKADYFYRDIYFAGNFSFAGLEVVYKNNKVIWAMNYFGPAFESAIDKEATLLKESLLQLKKECRFGQDAEFTKREFIYKDSGFGNIEKFCGKEQIFYKEKSIYELSYQGGLIFK